MMIEFLKKELLASRNDEKANLYQRFFKTGRGEYGEGDKFLGLSMPQQHEIANKYYKISLNNVQELLDSTFHEFRMTGLLILVRKFKGDEKNVFDFYLKNLSRINNWDLVDVTCHKIVGAYLLDKDRSVLYDLARSNELWKKRVSVISTFAFIRNNDFIDSIKICEILLEDEHDLIHKAVGWTLREIGKKNEILLKSFLKKHYKNMPRTMLRYSIERLKEKERKKFLQGKIQ
jgi:3-methyladenine DNA glycosylase AlkD